MLHIFQVGFSVVILVVSFAKIIDWQNFNFQLGWRTAGEMGQYTLLILFTLLFSSLACTSDGSCFYFEVWLNDEKLLKWWRKKIKLEILLQHSFFLGDALGSKYSIKMEISILFLNLKVTYKIYIYFLLVLYCIHCVT